MKIKKLSALMAGATGAAAAFYYGFFREWMLTWGSTEAERSMALPGDEMITDGVKSKINMTQAITIDAPPETVWPWLAQLGQDRAGWLSYDWLERLCGFGITNVYRIVPEWQDIKAGDAFKVHQNGLIFQIAGVEKNKHIITLIDPARPAPNLKPGQWEFFLPKFLKFPIVVVWSFHLIPLPGGKTRFIARGLADYPKLNPILNFFVEVVGGVSSCIMQIGMCRGLKACAEGTHPSL